MCRHTLNSADTSIIYRRRIVLLDTFRGCSLSHFRMQQCCWQRCKDLRLKDKDKDEDLKTGPRGSLRTRNFLEDNNTGMQTPSRLYALSRMVGLCEIYSYALCLRLFSPGDCTRLVLSYSFSCNRNAMLVFRSGKPIHHVRKKRPPPQLNMSK